MVLDVTSRTILAARSFLITAGPTHEPIDAVRYLGNRSSGRLGMALATAASDVPAATTLLLGPTCLSPPERPTLGVHRFTTTADLDAWLTKLWPGHDVLIMAAAVADFRPRVVQTDQKLRRSAAGLRLDLEPTPDLLAGLNAMSRPDQLRIGFALERRAELTASARRKLAEKNLDAIIANPIETLDSDVIEATLLIPDQPPIEAGRRSKDQFAGWLLGQIASRLLSKRTENTRET